MGPLELALESARLRASSIRLTDRCRVRGLHASGWLRTAPRELEALIVQRGDEKATLEGESELDLSRARLASVLATLAFAVEDFQLPADNLDELRIWLAGTDDGWKTEDGTAAAAWDCPEAETLFDWLEGEDASFLLEDVDGVLDDARPAVVRALCLYFRSFDVDGERKDDKPPGSQGGPYGVATNAVRGLLGERKS